MATRTEWRFKIFLFGRLNWANFLDWLITLCLGVIFIATTLSLGGVRPDGQLILLPLYSLLLILHGCWFASVERGHKRLSHVPLFFVPALMWLLYSIFWISPVPWRGWYEMIHALQLFIVFWVLSNNLRSRTHLGSLIIMSLVAACIAVLNGFYQFFQEPGNLLNTATDFPLEIHSDFLGRATGAFADPNSFAALLLVLIPLLVIAAAIPRLAVILRILAFYISLMFLGALVFSQSYWAIVVATILFGIIPWFCFRTRKRRIVYSIAGMALASIIFTVVIDNMPRFRNGLEHTSYQEGMGIRLVLWEEALAMVTENPITGVGAGAFGASFEQSPRVALADAPVTPHNDYLLVLSQLGIVGLSLFGIPVLFILHKAWKRWRREPYLLRIQDKKGFRVPTLRFFLSLGIASTLAFGLCLALTFIFYVPLLSLYGVLLLSVLVKTSFDRKFKLSEHRVTITGYALLATCASLSFYVLSSNKLEGQALELRAHQELDNVASQQIHISGNNALLDGIIRLYEDALIVDSLNVDALLGLSSSICQTYYRNPSAFKNTSMRAVSCASKAVELSPKYWKTWAQLGVARALNGDTTLAEEALVEALKLAPNNSNAHYYYAAYLSSYKDRTEDALGLVRRALEINPRNETAARLQRKLRIL